MFRAIRSAAGDIARRTALGLVSLLALCVGVFFLTIAGWIVLNRMADAATAALIIGGIYLGVGLILGAFALAKDSPPTIEEPLPERRQPLSGDNVFASMAAAFFEGLGAGISARDEFRRPTTRRSGDDTHRR